MTAALEVRAVRVPSRTTPGAFHDVLIGIDGEAQCSCPGFTHHGHCWAVAYVKEEMMTNESTALVPIKVTPPKSLVPSAPDLAAIAEYSASIIGARGQAFPKELDTAAKVYAVMAYGLELGVTPMVALNQIYLVNGRPQPSAQLMAGIALANEPSLTLEIVSLDDEQCTMRIDRPSRKVSGEYTYTMAEAKRAGSAGKDTWQKHGRDMLRANATKRILRAYAPDLINGVAAIALHDDSVPEVEYVTREVADATLDRLEAAVEAIEAEVAETPAPAAEPAGPRPPRARKAAEPTEEQREAARAWGAANTRFRALVASSLRLFGWDGGPIHDDTWGDLWVALEAEDMAWMLSLRSGDGPGVRPVQHDTVTRETLEAAERELTAFLDKYGPGVDTEPQQAALVAE